MISVEEVIEAASPETIEYYLGMPPYALEQLQENVYCLRNAQDSKLFLKQIAPQDLIGQNELRINRQLASTESWPGPRLLFTTQLGQATLACWEWAIGVDLRRERRDVLPCAFAELGRFHASHRNVAPVYSLTTRRCFTTVSAMLQDELTTLTTGLGEAVIAQCAAAFDQLRAGYVTWIHGDLHPGNIRVAGNRIQFVDWGYSANSLNLFDLSYVHRLLFREHETLDWWRIGPAEADAVLTAYFSTCGMDGTDWRSLHWAVEVWSTLYSYHNARMRKDVASVNESTQALHSLLAEA